MGPEQALHSPMLEPVFSPQKTAGPDIVSVYNRKVPKTITKTMYTHSTDLSEHDPLFHFVTGHPKPRSEEFEFPLD